MKTEVYKTADGRELTADIYFPENKKYARSPVYFCVHGGGWSGGNKDEHKGYLDLTDRLLADGFTLITFEYRLCDNEKIFFPTPVDDFCDGLRYFARRADEYGLDLDRAFVCGSSAGGHLALLGAYAMEKFGDDADRTPVINFRAVVDMCGPVDFEHHEVVPAQAVSQATMFRFLGYNRPDILERKRAASPITYLKKLPRDRIPPCIAVNGECDQLVHWTQPLILKDWYERVGVPFENIFVRYGQHNFGPLPGLPAPIPSLYYIVDEIYLFIKKYVLEEK